MTTTDSNGIIRYQTTDPVSPLHTLLNLGMQSVSDAITPLNALTPVYNIYTPVLGNTGSAPSIGNGVIWGQYLKIGRFVHFSTTLSMGSTTSLGTGSNVTWSLPVPRGPGLVNATCIGIRQGVQTFLGVGDNYNTSSIRILFENNGQPPAYWRHDSPANWGNSDQFRLVGSYQAES